MGNKNGKSPANIQNVRIATEHYRTRKERRNYPLQKWDSENKIWIRLDR